MIISFLQKLLHLLNIPETAIRYFRLSNKLSGLNNNNFPKELVPLNIKQLTRGMLNYTFFQHYPHWKRPYWAVKQYDPDYSGFIPRSHLAVSVNVTHRNWTAIGNMNCDVEPIVDPCGSVVPFNDGWSLECWIKYKNNLIIPAYCKDVKQKLVNNLPVVETEVMEKEFSVKMINYTLFEELVCEYQVTFLDQKPDAKLKIDLELILAFRPFNFEGVSPIDSISFNGDENSIFINNTHKIYFNKKPDKVILSNLQRGDCANLNLSRDQLNDQKIINCKYGFANAAAIFTINNISDEKKKISLHINLNKNHSNKPSSHSVELVKKYWQDILTNRSKLSFPDKKISSLYDSSLFSLLQFIDKDNVTPGPAIYHQFWFRDAVFQLNILDKLGFTDITKNIYTGFFKYQKNDGYFQSQKGEWDSNGQVLWLLFQNALLTNDVSIIRDNFSSLLKAVKWIEKNRLTDKKYLSEKYYGLLPKGLSAEHIGLADNYYWDNFWTIAGLKSFIFICVLLGELTSKDYAEKLLAGYEKVLKKSVVESLKSNEYFVLPSAPSKALDSGMIGSLAAIYPLQILDWQSEAFVKSLNYVHENYFRKNLFFQDIIHSGGNPYITMQIAHSYLFQGKQNLFNKIFNNVISWASPTLNYPEAIHTLTDGGVIGDGHHGWAAAEVLSSVRDMFVFEKNYYSKKSIELILLSGVSKEWFLTNKEISLKKINLLCGTISISCKMTSHKIELNVDYLSNKIYEQEFMIITLPFVVKSLSSAKKEFSISFGNNGTVISFNSDSMDISFNI